MYIDPSKLKEDLTKELRVACITSKTSRCNTEAIVKYFKVLLDNLIEEYLKDGEE